MDGINPNCVISKSRPRPRWTTIITTIKIQDLDNRKWILPESSNTCAHSTHSKKKSIEIHFEVSWMWPLHSPSIHRHPKEEKKIGWGEFNFRHFRYTHTHTQTNTLENIHTLPLGYTENCLELRIYNFWHVVHSVRIRTRIHSLIFTHSFANKNFVNTHSIFTLLHRIRSSYFVNHYLYFFIGGNLLFRPINMNGNCGIFFLFNLPTNRPTI